MIEKRMLLQVNDVSFFCNNSSGHHWLEHCFKFCSWWNKATKSGWSHQYFNFCVVHLPVKRDIKTEFPFFLFWKSMFSVDIPSDLILFQKELTVNVRVSHHTFWYLSLAYSRESCCRHCFNTYKYIRWYFRIFFSVPTGARLLNKMATVTNEWVQNIRWKLLSKRILYCHLAANKYCSLNDADHNGICCTSDSFLVKLIS